MHRSCGLDDQGPSCHRWYEDRKPRASSQCRSQIDLMIEKPAKAGNDGKSKAQPAPPLLLRAAESMELVEDIEALVLRNAGAGVAHVDSQLATTPAAAD